MADRLRDLKSSPKTNPTTPRQSHLVSSPQCNSSRLRRDSQLRSTLDYSEEIQTWIEVFRSVNKAVGRLYSMCAREGLPAFTEGAMQSLEHSLVELRALRVSQSDDTMDISDPLGTIDGELINQYLEDGLSPGEALVLLVRERAAEYSDDEKFENADESWADNSYYSFGSEKKVRSLSQGRIEREIEGKLSAREKPSITEVKRKAEDRMQKAQIKRNMAALQRQELISQKRRKLRKIKELMAQQEFDKKNAIQLQITLKQNRADERYEAHLNSIRQRAKMENMKSNEVVYIMGKNIEQKKMQLDLKIEETRERRQILLETVKSKQVDRTHKEEAAGRRRQALEEEREHKLLTNQQKLEEAESRRHKILEEKKTRAEELSKRRADRALVATPKQDREETKEQWESESCSSEEIPSLLAYKEWSHHDDRNRVIVTFSKRRRKIQKQRKEEDPKNWCSVCNYVLPDNLTPPMHTESQRHAEELSREIIQGNISEPVLTIPTKQMLEHQQELYMRKRAKKLKQTATNKAQRHEKACIIGKETTGTNKNRLQKLAIDLEKSISNNVDYGAVEGVLRDTIKMLDQRKEADLHMIRQQKFIPCLMEIVKKPWTCPRHEVKLVLKLLEVVVKFLVIFSGLSENRTYMIVSNRIIPVIDLLSYIMGKPVKTIMELTYLPQIFHLLMIHLKHRTPSENWCMREYFVEYLLNCGLILKLKQKLKLLQSPLDLSSNTYSLLLLKCVAFLEVLINFPGWGLGDKPAFEVSVYLTENFIYIFRETELAGIPYLLLSLLLHKGAPKHNNPCPPIPQTLMAVSILSMRFLNNLARLHLPLFQELLSGEEYSENMYYLFHYLLRYCSEHLETGPEDVRELLHEVTLLIGYFVMLNSKNQSMMNRGETCILQRLCALPFAYFTNKKYTTVLFPTLISVCYGHKHNLSILCQEMSVDLLMNYISQQWLLTPVEECKEEEKKDRSKKPQSISSNGSSSKSILTAASMKLDFVNRFPKHLWQNAIEFFKENIIY